MTDNTFMAAERNYLVHKVNITNTKIHIKI